MIDTLQNLVSSADSNAVRTVPCRGKNQIREKRWQRLVRILVRVSPACPAAMFACFTFCLLSMPPSASATTHNVVQNCGARGDGTTERPTTPQPSIPALGSCCPAIRYCFHVPLTAPT